MRLWDALRRCALKVLEAHTAPVACVAAFGTGGGLVSAAADEALVVRSVGNTRPETRPALPREARPPSKQGPAQGRGATRGLRGGAFDPPPNARVRRVGRKYLSVATRSST